MQGVCTVPGCVTGVRANDLCVRHERRLKRYGLNTEEQALADGIALCQSCGLLPATCIDHCHDTGRVRGVICSGCNIAEGTLSSPLAARRLANYMQRTYDPGYDWAQDRKRWLDERNAQ